MSRWVERTPQRGDHIRVARLGGAYYHHGVFVSSDEVIHFTGDDDDSVLDWSKAHVVQSDLQQFLRGGTVEVIEYSGTERDKLYPVEDIVEYARDQLGDTGYNLFFENCEHFANECTIGEHRSKQVERARQALQFAAGFVGGTAMGIFSKILSGALSFVGGLFGSSGSSSGRRPAKTEKVKLEEIERDRQLKLAALETERIKAELAAQTELIQEQTRARMAEAAQQAKLAELDNEFKLRLIDKDEERIRLMRDAQTDVIQMQAMAQIAIERARAEGLTTMANQIAALQERLLDIAAKRIAIIEAGSLTANREIEKFYKEILDAVEAKRDEYNTKKLPELLVLLGQYDKDSVQHEIFSAQINDDRELQKKFLEQQLTRVNEQQTLVLKSFLSSKDKIIEQTQQLTQQIAEKYLPQGSASLPALPASDELKRLSAGVELKQLPAAKLKQLPPAK